MWKSLKGLSAHCRHKEPVAGLELSAVSCAVHIRKPKGLHPILKDLGWRLKVHSGRLASVPEPGEDTQGEANTKVKTQAPLRNRQAFLFFPFYTIKVIILPRVGPPHAELC